MLLYCLGGRAVFALDDLPHLLLGGGDFPNKLPGGHEQYVTALGGKPHQMVGSDHPNRVVLLQLLHLPGNIHIRRFSLSGVYQMQIADIHVALHTALYQIGVKHQSDVATLIPLIVAENVDKRLPCRP